MSPDRPALQKLVQKLIAVQAAQNPSGHPGWDAIRACESLRRPLTKLAGVGGFRSLLSRALALARAEAPELDKTQIQSDGSFVEVDVETFVKCGGPAGLAGIAILTHLLSLLIAFVGEPLTLAIVRDAWPNAWPEEGGPGGKELP